MRGLVDFIRRVDNPADLGREHKERRDMLPGAPPGLHDARVLRAPRAVGELLQGKLRGLFAGSRVDRTQRRGERLAILVTRILQAVAHQMHDAGLHRRARVRRADRLGQPLEAIHHGDQDVLAATGL